MAGFSWFTGSLPVLSIGKNGKFKRHCASISALAACRQREVSGISAKFSPALPKTRHNFLPECGERDQSNFQFLASFSGRPQQLGFFFNQKNTGNVSDPFGVNSYP
ncbi:MAG: hypothetical protein WBJ68_14625 [Candidatus Dechloromonas phosphoritropha]|jgi:hypothetical protein|nr:hypothetical protein [Candidatus Dechloromonas phosphoritropha]MBP6483574.1 hypothetical protein [Rhodoferax sp.]MBP8786359.1 hypothetical protein [Azonexus sp.]